MSKGFFKCTTHGVGMCFVKTIVAQGELQHILPSILASMETYSNVNNKTKKNKNALRLYSTATIVNFSIYNYNTYVVTVMVHTT